MWKRRREENRQRAIEERKYFDCGGFGHMAQHCRNIQVEELTQVPSNKFEVLKDRVMQKGEESGREAEKDRKEILREERAKRGVEIQKIEVEKKKERGEKKEKLLREVMVKIRLKQEEEEEEIVVNVLLDSGATGLVMSDEFARKNRFRRTKLERPVYVRNVDEALNYVGLSVDTVEVEIFFKGYKERILIDIIGGQKQEVILDVPQLAHHNPEIDWRIGEVQMKKEKSKKREKSLEN